MTIKFHEELDGMLLVVQVSGKLSKADYERFVPETERLIKQFGKIRVLFEMSDFHGWELEAVWEDIKFDFKHFTDIERLAIIGDRAWEHAMAVFCKPFTTAKIQYFDLNQSVAARNWIHDGCRQPILDA
jgi:hypothetical protein